MAQPAEGKANRTGAPKRKRRWLRRLLIALAVLVVLGWAAPYLISTGPGTAVAVWIVNGRLRGTVHIDDLSLRWLDDCGAAGVRVEDTSGREVLNISQLHLGKGLLGVALSSYDFERVEVESRQVVLYEQANGKYSLAEALEEPPRVRRPRKRRKKPREPKPLPQPTGTANIKIASLRIVNLAGRSLEVTDIAGELDMQGLDDITGKLAAHVAGGRLRGELNVTELTDGYKVLFDQAKLTASLTTDGEVDLAAVGAFLGRDELAGRLTVTAAAKARDKDASATFDVSVTGLRAGRMGGLAAKPIDLALAGEVTRAGDKYEGQAKLTSGTDTITAEFDYHHAAGKLKALTLAKVLAAVESGEPIDLPELTIAAKGSLDAARIARAIPALLAIRKGTEIVAGRLEVNNVLIHGGAKPAASGVVQLVGLVSQREGVRERYEPIVADLSTAIVAGTGLRVDRADFGWGRDRLQLAGASREITGSYQVDLAGLQERLGQLVELGRIKLDGIASGAGVVKIGAERIDFAGRSELVKDEAKVIGQVTGRFRPATKLLRIAADIEGLDLSLVARTGFAGKTARRFGGRARLSVSIDRAGSGKPIIVAGEGAVMDLRFDDKPVGERETTFNFSGVRLAPTSKIVTVEVAELDSSLGRLEATDLRCAAGKKFDLDGRVEVTSNLAEALAAAKALAGWKQTPKIAGEASWAGAVSTSGAIIELIGAGRIHNFRSGAGAKAVREKAITFNQQIVVDNSEDLITIKKLNLAGELLTASASGTVKWFRTSQVLDITGAYRGSWERITALVHAFRPELAGEVAVTGPAEGSFKITGPASQPEIRPSFRGLDGAGEVGWASARFYGLPLGPATFKPTLHDGLARVPPTVIDASGGKVRLAADVDFRPAETVLTVGGKVTVLEKVPINREMGDGLLSRVIFFLHGSKKLVGSASLTTQDLRLPLGDSLKTGGSGSGRLDLGDVKIEPGQESGLDKILKLLGARAGPDLRTMTISGLDFEIRQGRVHYDNCKVVIGGIYDMKFTGSVGFDDTLQTTVWLPLTPALLQKFGIKVPGQTGRVLDKVRRVPVFIGGTRTKPKLDFSKVNPAELLKILPELLGPLLPGDEKTPKTSGDEDKDPLKDILDDLQDILRPKDETSPPDTQPAPPPTQPAPKKSEEQLLDLLGDLLRDKLEKED